MKPTERFSSRAEDYRRYRPGYPMAVIDLMRETCGLKAGAAVADIGSGTGIFSKLLLENGFEVTGVEPNEAMRAAAEQDLRKFARFHSVAAAAEGTCLPAHSYDAITAAQAFHWFNQPAARREFHRLLRAGGWVFIIWNDGRIDASPFTRDYEDLLKPLREPDRNRDAESPGVREFFPTGSYQAVEFANPHVMDWAALRGRFLSSSHAPAKDDPRQADWLARLEQVFERNAIHGRVTFDQVTRVYYGNL